MIKMKTIMKTNFNIAKNVRNSRSISALSALRKLHGLGLLLCALLVGSLQVWGATYTYDFTTVNNFYTTQGGSTHPATGSGNKFSNGDSFYASDGAQFTVLYNDKVYFNTGYIMVGNQSPVFQLPTYAGEKITQVKFWNSSGCSTSVKVTIKSGSSTASAEQTWSTQSSTYTYSIGDRYQASTLKLNVVSKNAQITKIEITTTSDCAKSVTINKGTGTNCTFTLSKSGAQASCDGVSTTVTVTPKTGYGNPSVTQSGASAAPTITGSGNNWTVTYAANTTETSTINVSCSAKTTTVSFNQNGGEGGQTSSKTATYGQAMPTPITCPTREHYDFAGYYDGSGGTGTKYYNADGSSAKNWDKEAATATLYAKWTEHDLTNYRTTCGVEITVSGSVWLTSYANVAVYTTNSPNNLITVTCTDFGSATRLGVKYIHNGDAVAKTSSPFRLCYYGFPDKTDYNKADGDGTAGGYDYINLSSDAKTAIASGQTFAIEYKPAADEYDQEDTYTIRLAALDGSTDKGQVDFTVHGRALPEQFVIASKVGDQWYALPNTILDNNRAIEPIKITVDNTTTPTRATNVPNTTAYQGTSRYESGTNRYGIRLTDPSGHWLQVSSSSGTNHVWVSGTGSSTCQDWNLSSTDFGAYTLTVPSSGAGDKKMGIKSGNMGYYASPDDPSQQIYLLPADFYTEAEAQILKWKVNSVIVMYTGTETSSTTKVGSNSASSAQTLSSQKLTHGIYELTTGQALTSNAGQTLALTFGSTKKEYDIPLIISGSTTASANGGDVVILSGGTFTAAATKYSFRNVYVYGGGKLAIPSGTSLGTSDIILRAGGISTNGSGGSATYEYVYPQFSLIGTLTNSSGKFRYEYVTDYYHWYHLCLPFDAALSTITYPQEYYGNNVTKDNKGSWVIKRYDGATRADGDYDAWVDIESESATEVTAGHGYIYWGAPKKVTISGDKQRQAWGIQRMTMTKAAPAATTAEADNKTVSGLEAYSGTGQVNDQGWNLVGNPYMVNLSGLSSTSLQTGKLVHEEVGGQWTGRWESNNDGMRYITQPSEHFDTYEAVKVTSATVTLTAGKAFFVQLAGDATALQFEASKRVNMPSLYRQNSVDVETGIVMSNSTYNDKVEFWIKDGKTAEYEVNADYPKTMNGTNFNIYGVHSHGNLSWVAIGPEIAEGSMPIGYQVPGEGDYTLSLLEPAASELESLLVTDHGVEPNVTVDLVEQDYVFHVNQAETNDARFTVSIELKDETPENPENPGTGVDENKDIERPIKFIYQDKLYILRNGVIYDATGKRVMEINK